jgi:hypothetical protein
MPSDLFLKFWMEDELKSDFCYFTLLPFTPYYFSQFKYVMGPVAWAIRMGRNNFVMQVMETKVICPHRCTSLTLTLICSTVERTLNLERVTK